MKSDNQAFTLIELLVVILIIGILVAVALPQYKVAVKKAQLAALIPLADAVYKGEEAYFLANGEYAKTLTQLDIEVPAEGCTIQGSGDSYGYRYICGNYSIGIHGNPSHVGIALFNNNNELEIQYSRFFTEDDNIDGSISKGTKACWAVGQVAEQICRQQGIKKDLGEGSPWEYRYLLL